MARRDRSDKVDDYFRQVADSLIGQIRRGTAPWTQAWKPGERAMPANVRTGKRYRGGNSVWLASTAQRRGFSDERWGTFKQVKSLGGHVRRGEKGCPILFWQFETKRLARDREGRPVLDAKGEPVHETRTLDNPRVYRYTVFNAEQCDGLPRGATPADKPAWEAHGGAERVLRESGAVISHTGSNRAYYDLDRDRIVLPFREQFPSGPSYYQTALHELGHWTGHESRLNRHTLTRGVADGTNSAEYAREELRAEISAMMTGDRLNVGHDSSRHASYVGSWIELLRDDPREIYRASRDAQEMSDYVLDRDRVRVEGREDPREPGEPDAPGPSPGNPSPETSRLGEREIADRLGRGGSVPAGPARSARRDRGSGPEL